MPYADPSVESYVATIGDDIIGAVVIHKNAKLQGTQTYIMCLMRFLLTLVCLCCVLSLCCSVPRRFAESLSDRRLYVAGITRQTARPCYDCSLSIQSLFASRHIIKVMHLLRRLWVLLN